MINIISQSQANPAAGNTVSQPLEGLEQFSSQAGFGDILSSLIQNLFPGKAGELPGLNFQNTDNKEKGEKSLENLSQQDVLLLGDLLQGLGVPLDQLSGENWDKAISHVIQKALHKSMDNPLANSFGNNVSDETNNIEGNIGQFQDGEWVNVRTFVNGLHQQNVHTKAIDNIEPEILSKIEAVFDKIVSGFKTGNTGASKSPDNLGSLLGGVKNNASLLNIPEEISQNEESESGSLLASNHKHKAEINQLDVAGLNAKGNNSNPKHSENVTDEFGKNSDKSSDSELEQAEKRQMKPEDFEGFEEVSLEEIESPPKPLDIKGLEKSDLGMEKENPFESPKREIQSEFRNQPQGHVVKENEGNRNIQSRVYSLPNAKFGTNPATLGHIYSQLKQLNGKVETSGKQNSEDAQSASSKAENPKGKGFFEAGFLVKTEKGWEMKNSSARENSLREGVQSSSKSEKHNAIQELGKNLKGAFEMGENTALDNVRPHVPQLNQSVENPLEHTQGGKHVWGQEKEIIRQISQGIISVEKDGVKEIKINLHPESLGKIKIVMEMLGDKINGKIEVENDDVRRVVENNLHKLKESVQQHQVKLDSIEVSVDSDKSHMASRQEREGRWGQNFGQGNGRGKQKEGSFSEQRGGEDRHQDPRRRWGYNTLELVA